MNKYILRHRTLLFLALSIILIFIGCDNDTTSSSGEREVWRIHLYDGVNHEPLLWNGNAYLVGTKGDILGVNAISGERIWANYTSGEASEFEATLCDGKLIVAAENRFYGSESQTLAAYDCISGEELWRNEYGENPEYEYYHAEISSPLVCDGSVFVILEETIYNPEKTVEDINTLFSYSPTSGEALWDYDLSDYYIHNMDKFDELLYLYVADTETYTERLIRFNTETGDVEFEMEIDIGLPYYIGDGYLIQDGYGCVEYVDLNSGDIIWTFGTFGGIRYINVLDNKLYVVAWDLVYLVDLSTGTEIAHFLGTGTSQLTKPFLYNNDIYIGNDEGRLYCLDSETLEKKWQYSLSGDIEYKPVVEDNLIFVGEKGHFFYCLQTGEF